MPMSRVLMALLALSLANAPAAAQQMQNVPTAQQTSPAPATSGLKVGVLEIQQALERTKEGQKAMEELQVQFAPRNAELQKIAQEIQELENQMRRQERTLSEEARLQLSRQLELKRRQGQRMQEDIQAEFQIAQSDHVNKILAKMQKAIDQYARERGYSIIINRSVNPDPVLYAAPAVDITDDIIRLYDQFYPLAASPPAGGAQKPAAQPAQPAPQPPQPKPPQPPR